MVGVPIGSVRTKCDDYVGLNASDVLDDGSNGSTGRHFINSTVRKLILEERDDKLPDAIRIGAGEGMQDFTMSLTALVNTDLIDRTVALEVAPNVEALKMALKGIAVSQPGIL